MSGLFGGGSSPRVEPIKPIETVKTPTKDSAAEAADNDIRKKQRIASQIGKTGTILTGLGSSSLEGTPVRKNILGGT